MRRPLNTWSFAFLKLSSHYSVQLVLIFTVDQTNDQTAHLAVTKWLYGSKDVRDPEKQVVIHARDQTGIQGAEPKLQAVFILSPENR